MAAVIFAFKLLCFTWGTGTRALPMESLGTEPIPKRAPLASNFANIQAIAPPWVSNPATRGTSSILYTCVVTISLCVYTAVHLNVPRRNTSIFRNVLRKARWVFIGIFAPELVVYTAFVQLVAVVSFRKQMNAVLSRNPGLVQLQDRIREIAYNCKTRDERDAFITLFSRFKSAYKQKLDAQRFFRDYRDDFNHRDFSEKMKRLFRRIEVEICKNNSNDSVEKGIIINESKEPKANASHRYHPEELNNPDDDKVGTHKVEVSPEGDSPATFDATSLLVPGPNETPKENAFPNRKVAWSYAWYTVMGGYTLDVSPLHDNYRVMTLTWHAVLRMAKDGLFLPTPKAIISDKSKADFLAKGIVICQVTFLVIELIARKVQGLPITLLELHTVVHVVCALAMYMAWLGKPLDIKDPISVDNIVWNNPSIQEGLKWQTSVSSLLVYSTNLRSWVRHITDRSAMDNVTYGRYNLDALSLENKALKRPWKEFCPEIPLSQILHRPHSFESVYSQNPSDFCFTKKVCKRWAMALSYLSMPLNASLPGKHDYFELVVGDFASGSYERNFLTTILAWLTCFAYGGIHSIGWDFTFATNNEKLLWRISCPLLVILGAPVYEFMTYIIDMDFLSPADRIYELFQELWLNIKWLGRGYYRTAGINTNPPYYPYSYKILQLLFHVTFRVIPFLCIVPYFAARIFLVTESFISLRHVPEGVYVNIKWANYIPHF